ncbi:MAG TPA: hypothetical protein VLH59_15560 [Ignavibacteriaceae bacterium]|nr:hypothetical protein [Ignavibacteriaceae bacterium]
MKKIRIWTDKEILFLKKYYPTKGSKYVAVSLGRTRSSVSHQTARLGLSGTGFLPFRPYSPQEIIFIKKNYPLRGAEYVAEKLGRSPSSIYVKANQLRVERQSVYSWSIYDINYLKKWYNKKRPSQIARHLGRTTSAVVSRASMLGLATYKIQRWTKYEEDFLIINFRRMTYKEIALHLKRSRPSVQQKCVRLKLKKKNLRRWKPQEKRLLSLLYGKITRAELAKRLNRTTTSIGGYAKFRNKTKKYAPAFTEKEKKFIVNNYLKMTNREIAQKLNRTYMGIFRMAAKLGLNHNPEKMKLRPEGYAPFFTDEEKEFIRKNYFKMTNKELAKKLKRLTFDGIRKYASRIGLTGNPEKRKYPRTHAYVYSEKEKNFIRKNYLRMTNKQIGLKLKRPEDGIAAMVGKLGLSGNPQRTVLWKKRKAV